MTSTLSERSGAALSVKQLCFHGSVVEPHYEEWGVRLTWPTVGLGIGLLPKESAPVFWPV